MKMAPDISKKASPASSFTPTRKPVLQRKCACGGTPGPTGECAECRRKRLQRRATNSAESATPPPIVHEVVRSSGQPLDPASRAEMEARFGHDFSRVRVHSDPRAAASAQAVDAWAYTVGNDVVFGAGKYQPGTREGKRLLAHELAHVVQQSEGPVGEPLTIGQPGDRYEQEADTVADTVARDHTATRENTYADRAPLSTSGRRVAAFGGKCLSQKIAYWAAAAAAVAACGGAIITSETGIGLVLLGAACVAAIAGYIAAIVSLYECMQTDPDADRREIQRLREEQERMQRRLRQVEEAIGGGSASEESE